VVEGTVVNEPLVSIGLPTRNRAASLGRAAASALAQDWGNVELVISDNASTDGTRALGERLQEEDARVRYIRQTENIGANQNYQTVLAESRGGLFMWLADDDWLDPDYVSACARTLLEHPDHSLVCGRARYYRGDELAFADRPMNLLGSSGPWRVVGYYRTVLLNGPFYGLMRRADIAPLPLPLVDWAWVAALAYRGKIRTLPSPAINRSIEGGSRDPESLARAFGMTPREARNWHLFVARAARRDVLHSPVYVPSSRPVRRALASSAWLLVATRFGWKVWLGRLLVRVGLFEPARAALERRRVRRG
jgi:glycosyltransferase involved in cell wall biosynthesis